MEQKIKGYYSGTSGFILPVPNKLHYPDAYRERSRLCYYASLSNSIEINSTFYKIPMVSTVQKWTTQVPEGFRFTFKLFKEITHSPHLGFDPLLIAKFMKIIDAVGDLKGCLLVQFPPSIKKYNLPQLSRLMQSLAENNAEKKWNIAFEFRDSSLYVKEVIALLEENGLGMVSHDKGASTSLFGSVESKFHYLRFHGPGGNYRGSYSEDVLSEYAGYIAEWLIESKEVFVYFNNTMGDAYGNLKMLNRFVGNII